MGIRMTTAAEIKKFIDEADEWRRKLGTNRMMIQRAHGVLNIIDQNPKKIPAWLRKELDRLRANLTYEEGEY